MDDYLPIVEGQPEPLFAKSTYKGELWPCFLEKAWAKIHGSYGKIVQGHPSDAASFLLGISSKFYSH